MIRRHPSRDTRQKTATYPDPALSPDLNPCPLERGIDHSPEETPGPPQQEFAYIQLPHRHPQR